ncbi:MAG: ABC transporter permease [Phycisphaerae bacterium]|jgi:phospholipid/cholesterol/gamma-HCH transport system permease protein
MNSSAANLRIVRLLGARLLEVVSYLGGMVLLSGSALRWLLRSIFSPVVPFGGKALAAQMVRVGIRSVGIVVLVQVFIGAILALQMAPALRDYGQTSQIALIIATGGFRMLGPIMTAVVLSGFAGASIAAELGSMVVSEEVEALEAMALNPVRYLVLPRVLATVIMMILLSIIADLMINLGGYIAAVTALGPEASTNYFLHVQEQIRLHDFFTGLVQAGVFGLLIGTIACHEGLKVRGGAEGVGRAATMTVVYSIVAIIVAACVFTVIFFVFQV